MGLDIFAAAAWGDFDHVPSAAQNRATVRHDLVHNSAMDRVLTADKAQGFSAEVPAAVDCAVAVAALGALIAARAAQNDLLDAQAREDCDALELHVALVLGAAPLAMFAGLGTA